TFNSPRDRGISRFDKDKRGKVAGGQVIRSKGELREGGETTGRY
ncbi:hypothetical protein GcM3_216050, partial [Golovinomyces cichoracearum]